MVYDFDIFQRLYMKQNKKNLYFPDLYATYPKDSFHQESSNVIKVQWKLIWDICSFHIQNYEQRPKIATKCQQMSPKINKGHQMSPNVTKGHQRSIYVLG